MAGRQNRGDELYDFLLRSFTILLLALSLFISLGAAGFMLVYAYVAPQLPPPEELARRAVAFSSTKIYDREGRLLYEFIPPGGGRRTVVPLSSISPYVIMATVATEDARFFQHQGVDPIAVIRALWQDIVAKRYRERAPYPSNSSGTFSCPRRRGARGPSSARLKRPYWPRRSPAATPRRQSWNFT